tara:strand:+ start:59 stop:505 length:447 start_codon:yes stop_codon:yes gene_type:complete
MVPEHMAALGFAAARRMSEENATTTAAEEDGDGGFVMPFWGILALIVLILTMLLCGCTCFVIRCFAPEVTQGPAWEVNSYGTRWVKGIHPGEDGNRNPVVHANSSLSYPGGVPVHEPKHDVYDENDVRRHMRPKNFDKLDRRLKTAEV